MTAPAPSPERQLAVAFSLARHGFHVFPVSQKKVPLVKGWQHEATTDPERIATWWTVDFPGALVGYACGPSGVVVADLDLEKTTAKGERVPPGRETLDALGLELPATPMTYPTRSGGEHHVYAAPAGRDLTIAQGRPGPGVDVRAGNGFAVYYGRKLREAPALPPAPDFLLFDRIQRDTKAPDAELADWLAAAPDGKPSKALRKAAQRIGEHDTDHGTLLAVTSDLVAAGTRGEAGAAELLREARDRYSRHYPDHAAAFDEATLGSIRHHGLPPRSLALTKAEKKALKSRKDPRQPGTALELSAADRQAIAARVADDSPHPASAIHDDLSDAELAEHVAETLAHDFTMLRGLGVMRYDGQVWRESDEQALIEATRKIMRETRSVETAAAIMRGDKKREQEARALEQRSRVVAVARFAAGIMAEQNRVPDAHPDLLNTPSGVVNLRTGELGPHDADLTFTKITAAPYDPGADRSTWTRALEAVPPKVADWLQVRFGQAATGYMTSDDRLAVLMGSGHNGKTTILNAAREALGGYAVTVPKRLLLSTPGDHPTELTTLMGARLAVLEELPEGRNLNVERLKDVLGTPVLTARRMRENNVSWRATHSLILSTNYLPVVAETDHGTWRRLALVTFPYRFVTAADLKASRSKSDRLRDDSIRDLLSQPDPGVLAWMVEGARRWYEAQRRIPEPPKSVKRATDAWRMDADPVLGYIAERLVVGADAEGWAVSCFDLAHDFNAWLEQRGHRAWSLQTINARLAGHEAARDAVRKNTRLNTSAVRASRPASAYKALPAITMSWVGIRYRADAAAVPVSPEVANYGLAQPD